MARQAMQRHCHDTEFVLERPDGLAIKASGRTGSQVLLRFFEGYDRAFVLPDEREEIDGFNKCLALNEPYRRAFGRTHCELVCTFETQQGDLLGGANFLAIGHASHNVVPSISIALNYIYVEQAARGRGLLRTGIDAVRELALVSLGQDPSHSQVAIFIEQNDPFKLTAEEYAEDTRHSGLDQFDRLNIWAKVGARLVDFPYVQPALSVGQNADDGLIYAALNYPFATIDCQFFHDHLESFFRISVLKGEAEIGNNVVERQLNSILKRTEPIGLLTMQPALLHAKANDVIGVYSDFREFCHSIEG